MARMVASDKGSRKPLNVTQKANRRVFVGLSWDPTEQDDLISRVKGVLTGKQSHHDLDLSCFMYDKNQKFISVISGKIGQIVDSSGGIYHSGDDTEGAQEGDDEQISVELANLPETVQHLVFKVSVASGHHFDEVQAPSIRLVDGYSKHHFIKRDLSGEAAQDKTTYVFLELFRQPHEDGNWMIHIIDDYRNWGAATHWKKKLSEFLTLPTLGKF